MWYAVGMDKKAKKRGPGRPSLGDKAKTPAQRAKLYRIRLSRLGARRFVLMLDGGDLALVAIVAKSLGTSMTGAIRALMKGGMRELSQETQDQTAAVERAYRAAQASGEVPG